MITHWWRKLISWLLWIFVLPIPVSNNLEVLYPGNNLLARDPAIDPINSFLEASLVLHCTTVFITDGGNSSVDILQMLYLLTSTKATAYMDVPNIRQNNNSLQDITSIVHLTLKIKHTSTCAIIVIFSNDVNFITNTIKISFEEDLLSNPSRLLLLTRIPKNSLQMIRSELSVVNAAVFSLAELALYQRCVAYMYLPYSQDIKQIASWTSKYGLAYFTQNMTFPDKNKRLSKGGHLKLAAISFPPQSIIKVTTAEDGSSQTTITGCMMEVVKMLSNSINFTYEIDQFTSFGYQQPNGSWDGLVGVLLRKEADIALGPSAITYARSRVIQYTVPILVDYAGMRSLRGDTAGDPWGFTLTFTPEVWASLFVSLALAILTSRIYAQLTNQYASPRGPSFAYCRILLMQDINKSTHSWWERLIIGAWMMTILILLESFSGNLMSQLAVRYISQPYQTLKDVLDDPNIKIMWMANSVYEQYLRSAESGTLLEVAESEKDGKITFVETSTSIMAVSKRLVDAGTHASVLPYLGQKIFLTEAFTDQGSCKYYIAREQILPFTFAMTVQKNCPLLQAINDRLRGIVEFGLYNHWLEKAVPLAKGCKNPPTKITVRSSLSVSELWGIFVTLFLGYGISFSAFFLELMTVKLRKSIRT